MRAFVNWWWIYFKMFNILYHQKALWQNEKIWQRSPWPVWLNCTLTKLLNSRTGLGLRECKYLPVPQTIYIGGRGQDNTRHHNCTGTWKCDVESLTVVKTCPVGCTFRIFLFWIFSADSPFLYITWSYTKMS